MKLYHASTVVVKRSNARIGRKNTDFGKGFYTTTDFEQAARWARIRSRRAGSEVANDNLYATISMYENGQLSVEAAIVQLNTHVLCNQVSFHTNEALSQLKYLESIRVE